MHQMKPDGRWGRRHFLLLAVGLLTPDRGSVLIKGVPRKGLSSDDDTTDKLKIGLVFQSAALFDSLTVGQASQAASAPAKLHCRVARLVDPLGRACC